MGGTVYPIDANAEKREDALREVTARIEDLQSVLHTTNNTRRNELSKIADSVSAWWAIVRKEKIIYSTMNLFQYDAGRRTLVAEGWVATRDIHGIQIALRNAAVRTPLRVSQGLLTMLQESTGAHVPPILHELANAPNPPTFIRTNKFTNGFQSIVDAYGIASYGEVNPGLFTLITLCVRSLPRLLESRSSPRTAPSSLPSCSATSVTESSCSSRRSRSSSWRNASPEAPATRCVCRFHRRRR
jgi:V-type H+-transporting ATPase subunit a